MSARPPARTRWIVIGAGFAGAATAWALGERGLGPGVILEQEMSFGVHASGRNAALFKVSESDPIVAALGQRSLAAVRRLESNGDQFISRTGGLTLGGKPFVHEIESLHRTLEHHRLSSRLLSADQALREFPFLEPIAFDIALWCGDDGVADIHALLGRYLERARKSDFTLHVNTRVVDLLVEGGRVAGVRTDDGHEIRGEVVVD
ncbi:MAG TPA: FAD-dependent oxidoreductase, partial [Gemmatimonadaceae bacterium]|nr:FAD-dependent oxidoreductase [Gemmatimonadaceae bacterium]